MSPKIISAKFVSNCPVCKRKIFAGERVIWEKGKKAAHVDCSKAQVLSYNPIQDQKSSEIKISSKTPSKYQQDIFEELLNNNNGHTIIEAVAGSGKTWTIIESLKRLKLKNSANDVLFLAFNKHIVKEIQERIPYQAAKVQTSNSFGFSLIKGAWKNSCQFKQNKTVYIFCNHVFNYEKMGKEEKSRVSKMLWSVISIVSLAKNNGIGSSEELKKNWIALAEKHSVDVPNMSQFPEFESVLLQTYRLSLADRKNIDFDDMLLFPVLYRNQMHFPNYTHVFIDECQDLNPIQIALIKILADRGSKIVAVGDSRQAIYGFRGADPESFSNLQQTLNAKEMPLSICYRCPKSVVREAQAIVPEIECSDTAPEGEILDIYEDEFIEMVKAGDYVLCRTTAPLVKRALQLLGMGRKAYVIGRDIGKDLVDIVDRLSDRKDSIYLFMEALSVWSMEAKEKAMKRLKYNAIVEVQDKIDSFAELVNGLETVQELVERIENIFSDDDMPGVNFSTIHRAKGLEANNIYILFPELLPHPMAQQEWEIVQEYNLKYVMVTRVLANKESAGKLVYVHEC